MISRLLLVCFIACTITVLGCSRRGTGDDAAIPSPDAGGDARASEDAFVADDAATAADGGSDAGHDAARAFDAGCAAPTCDPLPASCHYDDSLDPCRCGMIVCETPADGCTPSCGAGSFCQFTIGTCGENGAGSGACVVMPDLCSELYMPVCGCDGRTYSNGCFAAGAGQSIVHDGACETPTDCRSAGCPGGQSCVACRGAGYVCLSSGSAC